MKKETTPSVITSFREKLGNLLSAYISSVDMDEIKIIREQIFDLFSEAEKRGREEGLKEAVEALPEEMGGTDIEFFAERGGFNTALYQCREAIESKIKKV